MRGMPTLAEAQASCRALDKKLKAMSAKATPEDRARWAREREESKARWKEIVRNTPEAERREMEEADRRAFVADCRK